MHKNTQSKHECSAQSSHFFLSLLQEISSPSMALVHDITLHLQGGVPAGCTHTPMAYALICIGHPSPSFSLTHFSLNLTCQEQEAWELKCVRARKRERLWMNPRPRSSAQQELSGSASGHAGPQSGAGPQQQCMYKD